MQCSACSSPMLDDANYCPHCGTRRSADGVAGIRREICEIYRTGEEGSWFRAGDTYWEAIAIGPSGRYTAARSETCPRTGRGLSGGIARSDELLDQLIAKLVQEGWVPIPRGQEWYSYRFERQAAPALDASSAPSPAMPPANASGRGDA